MKTCAFRSANLRKTNLPRFLTLKFSNLRSKKFLRREKYKISLSYAEAHIMIFLLDECQVNDERNLDVLKSLFMVLKTNSNRENKTT